MAFHLSADLSSLELVDNHILTGLLCDENGDMQSASIDLDEYIGNYDGWFEWQGVGFSQSASDVTLTMGEDGSTPTLEAMLAKADGEFRERQGIQLGDRIGNIDGKFEFVEG